MTDGLLLLKKIMTQSGSVGGDDRMQQLNKKSGGSGERVMFSMETGLSREQSLDTKSKSTSHP